MLRSDGINCQNIWDTNQINASPAFALKVVSFHSHNNGSATLMSETGFSLLSAEAEFSPLEVTNDPAGKIPIALLISSR